jgi:hypothetical protein
MVDGRWAGVPGNRASEVDRGRSRFMMTLNTVIQAILAEKRLKPVTMAPP